MMIDTKRKRILLVDDEPTNLRVLMQVLQKDYTLFFAKNGEEALELARSESPDLVLLDVMMPGMSGFEVCQQLKESDVTKKIPVIFVTALKDEGDETKGFGVGAVDYISKPISPAIVKARVKTHLSLIQSEELKNTHLEVIQRLGRASEYKDNETGLHIIRMSHYSRILALSYGYSEEDADELFHAAPMHDIGKIGIPDSIIMKPGKLTDEEFDIMRSHTLIGAEILGECNSSLLKLAKVVAMFHHEKWDGTGYPDRLKGEEIPLGARIVALADVFDALTSKRPYKEAWTVEKTMNLIREQSGKHFDPAIVSSLEKELDAFILIKDKWGEESISTEHTEIA